jgi:hypothetical protein
MDETQATLRAKICHYWLLAPLVTDAGTRADIAKMIEELEQRLREQEDRQTAAAGHGFVVTA